jgi:hypothetical protein
MIALDLLVRRRGTDPAAETCSHALADLLDAPVAGVERGDLWRFELADLPAGSLDESREAIERAAARAGRYVNLNRDVCGWLRGPLPYPEAAPRGGTAVDLWVCDGEGRDEVALAYFRARCPAGLQDLRRGTWWRLWLRGGTPHEARERAWDLAFLRSREHGLLCNPHAQQAEILSVVHDPSLEGAP